MTENLVNSVINGIQEKKGSKIVTLDLQKLENSVCDYFVICQADSTTQVSSIADSVEDVVKKETKERVWHSDGYDNSIWIVLDYGSVMVHVFQTEWREFYDIEGLWADAEIKVIADA